MRRWRDVPNDGFTRYAGAIVFFGRFIALLRAFAALLADANGLSPLRFFVCNAAGAIAWATMFGLGSYLLGEGIRRIAGPDRMGYARAGGHCRLRRVALQEELGESVGQAECD
jgi:membrane protein DedA with SNARE-associated domain